MSKPNALQTGPGKAHTATPNDIRLTTTVLSASVEFAGADPICLWMLPKGHDLSPSGPLRLRYLVSETLTEEDRVAAESNATTVWNGDLTSGRGTTSVASGVFPDFEVSWPARTERTSGTTSPEELLAAAHSACFCMALSNVLAKGGNTAEQIEASTVVSFVPGEGVKAARFTVRGRVPGLDQAAFEDAARDASENCPISQALKGNIEITVEATLSNQG